MKEYHRNQIRSALDGFSSSQSEDFRGVLNVFTAQFSKQWNTIGYEDYVKEARRLREYAEKRRKDIDREIDAFFKEYDAILARAESAPIC